MDPLDKFGEFVVTKLRDSAIDYSDGLLKGEWKSPSTQELQNALRELTPQQRDLVRRVVIHAVDGGIHDFLFAIGESEDFDKGISIIVDGENIASLSDGLHGESSTDEGWYSRFSKHGMHPDPS